MDVLTYKGKEADKLNLLKNRLMEMYAPSEDECFSRMMTLPMLQPGQKPSALFANLHALLPHDVEDGVDSSYLFRMIFLSRLPENIKSLVYAQGKKPVSEMAAFADTVVLNKSKMSLPIQQANFSWLEEIEAAEAVEAVHTVQTVKKPMVKGSRRSSGMCFYHTKFENKAERCEVRVAIFPPPSTTTKLSGN